MKVRLARTESFRDEYSNVTVDVELDGGPSDNVQDLLERCSQEVASRLHLEKARRRQKNRWWVERTLEQFGDVPILEA